MLPQADLSSETTTKPAKSLLPTLKTIFRVGAILVLIIGLLGFFFFIVGQEVSMASGFCFGSLLIFVFLYSWAEVITLLLGVVDRQHEILYKLDQLKDS